MSDLSREQTAKKHAIIRRSGMNEKQRERLRAHNRLMNDWRAHCRRCGFSFRGSLENLECPRCKSSGSAR